MLKIEKILAGVFLASCLHAVLHSGTVLSLDLAEDEGARIERAILGGGGGGHQDIVGGGSPGRDFPALSAIPQTDFSCQGRSPGYYADEEFGCQVFHICHTDRRKDSFLCPNGTIFHQLRLVCDWWYNVDCSSSDLHVSVNNDIGRTTPKNNDRQPSSQRKTSFTSISNLAQNHQTTSVSSFQNQKDSSQFRNDISNDGFGVPLQTISNSNNRNIGRVSNNVPTTRVTSRPATTQGIRFPPSVQEPPPRQTTRSRVSANPVTGVPLASVSNRNITPRPTTSQNNRNFNSISPTTRTGVNLPASNFNPPITTLAPNFPPHFNIPKPGIALPAANNVNNNANGRGTGRRVTSARRITINKRPISTTPSSIAVRNQIENTRFPSRGSPSPFGIPLPPSQSFNAASRTSSQNNAIPRQQQLNFDDGKQNVAILDDEKIATQFFKIGSPRVVSNNIGRPLPQSNSQSSNNRNAISNNNIGLPAPVTNRQSNRGSNFGVPLPASNLQSNNRNNAGESLPATNHQSNRGNNFGVPLPATNLQSNNRNNAGVSLPATNHQSNRGNNFGVPLPATNLQSNNRNNAGVSLQRNNQQSNNRNNVGVPLPGINSQTGNQISTSLNNVRRPSSRNQQSNRNNAGRTSTTTNRQSNNLNNARQQPIPTNRQNNNRNNVGRPLPVTNQQTNNRNNVGIPLPAVNRTPNNRNNVVTNIVESNLQRTPSSAPRNSFQNINRGSTTFRSSQRNREVNALINNRNRPALTQPFTIVRDFDDDLFDDLDDLNDPFDDDRFDLDDRFDDDRFDDDRFDDDRFDDDRFDDDRFDDDRFDDDRFDDDRFDDDRFDLDDRFDDDRFDGDDRFDNDPFDDDRFDFDDDDDDFDDRLNRFGNGVGFNFGRRPRGSTFPSDLGESVTSKKVDTKVLIEPPSEIQLPPPPL